MNHPKDPKGPSNGRVISNYCMTQGWGRVLKMTPDFEGPS